MTRVGVALASIVVLAAALGGAAGVAGCAWLDEGPPTRSCRSNRDCFTAQGEVCDPVSQTCVTVDAAAAAPEPP